MYLLYALRSTYRTLSHCLLLTACHTVAAYHFNLLIIYSFYPSENERAKAPARALTHPHKWCRATVHRGFECRRYAFRMCRLIRHQFSFGLFALPMRCAIYYLLECALTPIVCANFVNKLKLTHQPNATIIVKTSVKIQLSADEVKRQNKRN